MTAPAGGPIFVLGLNDDQMAVMEQLAEDYMIEVLTQVANRYADRMLLAAGEPLPEVVTAAVADDLGGVPGDVTKAISAAISPLVAEAYYSSAGKLRTDMIRNVHAVLPPVYSLDALARVQGIWSEAIYAEVGHDMWTAMRGELAEGLREGESVQQIAQRIRGTAGTTVPKATLYARTAIVGASNGGSYDMARASGLEGLKEWLCVAAGTRVSAVQPLEVVERRRAPGWLTTLTTHSGRVLTVTPNHPVLTDRGWVRAHSLKVGDNLVCHRGQQISGVDGSGAVALGNDPDVQHMPPAIDQVFGALAQGGARGRMVSAAVDLYSDPADCEVEVISIDGDLLSDVKAALGEPRADHFLALTDEGLDAFAAGGALAQITSGRPQGPIGDLRLGSPVRPFALHGPAFALVAHLPGCTLIADRDALISQEVNDGSAPEAVPLAEHGDRPALDGIELDELAEVTSEWAVSGHSVYDLTTDRGWYVANEIIVHNSTPDARTRPTHRRADGQRVPLDGKFTVGGYPADHPGDPTLPPDESFRCRCSLGYVFDEQPAEGVAAPSPARRLPAAPVTAQEQRNAERARWGTNEDPASKMTVTDLRAIIKAESTMSHIRQAQPKAALIAQIRDWQSVYMRKVLPDLPPLTPELLVRAVTPSAGGSIDDITWADPHPSFILGTTADRLPTGPLPPGGVRVDHWVIPSGDGYVMEHGRAWRIDGVDYIIETPMPRVAMSDIGIVEQTSALGSVRHLHSLHVSVPNANKYNRRYHHLIGPSPSDAYWQKKFNDPGHVSAASAGSGRVFIYSGRKLERALFAHETGHNADQLTAKPIKLGSDSQSWEAAAKADSARNIGPEAVQFFRPAPDFDGHPLTPGPAVPARAWPQGVSDYGKSSPGEDWAESYASYVQGRLGDGFVPGAPAGQRSDVYFRDLFPNRAAILDTLFPDFAAKQLAEIAARRAALAKFHGPDPAAANKAIRDAAKARQKTIDTADKSNAFLADIDETVGSGLDPGVLDLQLRNAVTARALTKAEADAVRRAAESGDPAKVRAILARHAKKRGVIYDNAAGDILQFDRATMRGTGPAIAEGAPVRVQRRGSMIRIGDEVVRLDHAQVRALDADELGQIRQREIDRLGSVAEVAAQLRADIARGAEILPERVGTLADREGLAPAVRNALVLAASKGPEALTRTVAAQLRAAGIKAQGAVGRGVVFDAKSMQFADRRTKVEPGAKVKIIEAGYVADVDGVPTVLRRALVEPVAPKVVAPKVPKLSKEEAARVRMTAISEVRSSAQLLAEAAELAGQGATREAIEFRIRARAKREKLPDSLVDPLLAALDGGPSAIAERVALLAGREGLTPIGGDVGEVVELDRKAHRTVDGKPLPKGTTSVRVVRPGYSFTYRGETITLEPALVEVAPSARIGGLWQRRSEDLGSFDGKKVAETRALGGALGDTHLIEFADGSRLIQKNYSSTWLDSVRSKEYADAEELGAAVLDAVGVRAPGVRVLGSHVDMEFIPGETLFDRMGHPKNVPAEILDSDDGRLMGIADYLMANSDRNAGNLIFMPDGRLAGIDHGMGFQYAFTSPGTQIASGSDFTRFLSDPDYGWWKLAKRVDVAPADIAVIRERLKALKPLFVRAGREDWHKTLMSRLALLARRADPGAPVRLAT